MQKSTSLQTYVETVTGQPLALGPAVPELSATLPLLLRDRYRLYEGEIFGRSMLLAEETKAGERASTKEYAAHLAALEARYGLPAVLVPRALPSYARNRLVHARVPFIVPGSQMFLPMLFVDLRERAPRMVVHSEGPLSPPAQVLLLHHLAKHRLDAVPLREIAGLLGYSAMMITKAKDELVAADLASTHHAGRAVHLAFPTDRRAHWDHALPRLSTPVRRSRWIRWSGSPPRGFALAGVTALSRQTSLADDRLPTHAAQSATLNAALQAHEVTSAGDSEDADARVEAWRYDPCLLARDGVVDPLSLFLSLRDSPDERIQQALASLLEDFQW